MYQFQFLNQILARFKGSSRTKACPPGNELKDNRTFGNPPTATVLTLCEFERTNEVAVHAEPNNPFVKTIISLAWNKDGAWMAEPWLAVKNPLMVPKSFYFNIFGYKKFICAIECFSIC